MTAKSAKKTPRRAPARVEPPVATSLPWPALLAIAIVLVTIAVYAQVASHDFVDLDDGGYVVTNPHVTTGLTTANIAWAFTTGYAANWHPLTWLSHQLDASVFGTRPGPQHIVNVVWHVINTLLLFGLLRAMTGALWRSAFVAAIFAVHPAHVESVAWIAERKDVLSTCFWFAATWAYVGWVRRPVAWRYAATVALFALGLMSKPMLVTLPFTLLLLDVWPLARTAVPWTRRIVEKLPLFAMAIASSVVTTLVQQRGGAVGSIALVPLSDRLANAIVACGRYLSAFVWPVDLAVFYPYVSHLPVMAVAGAALVLVAISALAWQRRRSEPFLLVGWLWFLGTLVPVIGLVQIGTQAMADRYTYVPYVGLLISVAWGVRAMAARSGISVPVLRAVAIGAVLASAAVAHAQAATWLNSETLWRRAVSVTTGNARAHNSLGVIYGNAGRPEDASAQFQEALRLQPDLTEARNIIPNLGRSLMAQGKVAEALPHLLRATQIDPDRAEYRHQLALAYFALDRKEEAIASWREAVRLNPQFEEAYFTMAMVLAGDRRINEARQAFLEVLRINPGRTDAQQALTALGGKK